MPFYQVPFLPVKDSTSFQRGRMPEGSNPRGVLLREIMPYFYIREEEVPRTGVNVTRRWQRTRWTDGSVCQWIGREKETGKGEGSSGLQFDLIRQAKI